jgi:hypothetical protein
MYCKKILWLACASIVVRMRGDSTGTDEAPGDGTDGPVARV